MPTDQLEAPEASELETPDLLPEVNTPEAPPADASIPADEGSAELADESSSEASEAAPADEAPSIDPALAALAQSYDLDPADFPNEHQLRKAVARMDKQLADWYGHLTSQQQPQGQPQQPASYQQQPAQPQQVPGSFDINKLLADAYGAEVDPATQKLFTQLHQHYEQNYGGKLTQVEKVLQHLPAFIERFQAREQYHEQQEAARIEQSFDEAFDGLPEEWTPIFGKGSLAELPPHSPQAQARVAAARQVEILEQAQRQVGRKPESVKSLLQRSLPLSFPQHFDQIARKRVTSQLKRNNGAALARPSQKTGKPVDGIKRAVERNRKFDALVESLD